MLKGGFFCFGFLKQTHISTELRQLISGWPVVSGEMAPCGALADVTRAGSGLGCVGPVFT